MGWLGSLLLSEGTLCWDRLLPLLWIFTLWFFTLWFAHPAGSRDVMFHLVGFILPSHPM